MKNLPFIFIPLLLLSGIQPGNSRNNGTEGNPFARYGTNVPVGTFSDNPEFHDGECIVEIGPVKYDTRTREVTGFTDTEDPSYLPPEIIALSPDPHCEKYYFVSPYVVSFNNPLRFTDPDGRDVWEINNEGRIVNRIEDTTQDAFFMVAQDSNGDYQRTFTMDANGNKQYNSISFGYGTVESQKSISYHSEGKTDTYDEYKIRGDQNGTDLFEFMSNHVTGSLSQVEIGLAQTGIKGDKGLNFITTGHIAGKEPGGSYIMSDRLYYGYTTRTLIHSHPKSDYASLKDLQYKFQVNTVLQKQKLSIPIYEIFYVPTNTYIKY